MIFASISIPVFWLGLVMIYLLSVYLRWLPPSGFVPIEDGLWPRFSRMIMPVIAVSLAPAALIARQVRGAVLGVTRSDYIVAARAKGLSRKVILRDYVLRNAMVPVLTVLGLEVASLLAGAVLAESVFSLPGIRVAAAGLDLLPRLHDGAGRRRAHRGDDDPGQPHDRPALCGRRPAECAMSSIAIAGAGWPSKAAARSGAGCARSPCRARSGSPCSSPSCWSWWPLALVTSQSPTFQDYTAILKPPSAGASWAPITSDRDVFARVLYGGQVSLIA